MTTTNGKKPIFFFLTSLAIFLAIGLFLLGSGIHMLLEKQGNSALSGVPLLVLGCVMLIATSQRIARAFQGKAVFQEVISLPLLGTSTHELTIPIKLNGGRLIIFFENTPERYYGKLTLSKSLEDASAVSINLPRTRPHQIKVPKWLPTTDAGGLYENWPRRTGQCTDPVVIHFPFPVEAMEKLKLKCELGSNFNGTKMEKRFPIKSLETIRLCIRR